MLPLRKKLTHTGTYPVVQDIPVHQRISGNTTVYTAAAAPGCVVYEYYSVREVKNTSYTWELGEHTDGVCLEAVLYSEILLLLYNYTSHDNIERRTSATTAPDPMHVTRTKGGGREYGNTWYLIQNKRMYLW